MIRIGFCLEDIQGWMGGVNYIKNLLFAISQYTDRIIEPVVFLGKNIDDEIVDLYKHYAEIINSSVFDRKSLSWFCHKIFQSVLGFSPLFYLIMKKNDIDIVSHSFVFGKYYPFKIINWIPDFQHFRMPNFFSKKEVRKRNRLFKNMIRDSDQIILSSKDSLKDYKSFAPGSENKAHVLYFVSQPISKVFSLDYGVHKKLIERKYNFDGKYFYLPNHFWKHKNHMVVFEAVKMLKEKNHNILLLCTGHMEDRRDKEYMEYIKSFLVNNELEDNIRLLGLIEYDDVQFFMRDAISIINPSLFEGWSSTVEEAKSIGKNVILSDIPIHREQNPKSSIFFNPFNPSELASILWKKWQNCNSGPDIKLEREARKNLVSRTQDYAKKYQYIIVETTVHIEQ